MIANTHAKIKYFLFGNFFVGTTLYLYIETKKKKSNKLNIIFDLDETILHTEKINLTNTNNNYIKPDFTNVSNRNIWIRPGVNLLLPHLSKFNNVYLYTRATKSYTDNILEYTKLNKYFLDKKYRTDCKKNNCKNITDFGISLDISKSYLIDDKIYNQCDGQNLYNIKPFYPVKSFSFDINSDTEFFKLYFYVIWLNISNDLADYFK